MIDPKKLRSWWSRKQGLDGLMAGWIPAKILEKAGWARSVGGANPGLWEYEPATNQVVWSSFSPATKELKVAIQTTETFVRDQLGDARSFSLDSPESRKPRIEFLRK